MSHLACFKWHIFTLAPVVCVGVACIYGVFALNSASRCVFSRLPQAVACGAAGFVANVQLVAPDFAVYTVRRIRLLFSFHFRIFIIFLFSPQNTYSSGRGFVQTGLVLADNLRLFISILDSFRTYLESAPPPLARRLLFHSSQAVIQTLRRIHLH